MNIIEKRKVKDFICNIFRMHNIKRWNLMKNLCEENLAQHSYDCAIIANCLSNIGNLYYKKNYDVEKITLCALFHDVPEIIIGDCATPVKHSTKQVETMFKSMEKKAMQMICKEMPIEMKKIYLLYLTQKGLSELEKRIIKVADKISAYMKALRESMLGNYEYESIVKLLEKEILDLNCEEASFFFD